MAKEKIITVYGTGKGNMVAGKDYQVNKIQGDKLVKQGFASLKPIKTKEEK